MAFVVELPVARLAVRTAAPGHGAVGVQVEQHRLTVHLGENESGAQQAVVALRVVRCGVPKILPRPHYRPGLSGGYVEQVYLVAVLVYRYGHRPIQCGAVALAEASVAAGGEYRAILHQDEGRVVGGDECPHLDGEGGAGDGRHRHQGEHPGVA